MNITSLGSATLALLVISKLAPAADVSVESLEQTFESLQAPGAVIGIQTAEQPPEFFTFGLAEVDQPRAVTTVDHFRIGSVSKVLVGTAALILAGEGKLSLVDPIEKYVAGLPNDGKIRLHHAGSHRSGLFNHIESRDVKQSLAADPTKWRSLDELLIATRAAPVYFEPGESHHYANANTVVLALAIEQVTGRPWDEVVKERVIDPLGLTETSIPRDNKLPDPFAHGYAFGTNSGAFFYRGETRIDVTETSPSWWGPAGSMISTAGDLLKAAKPLATGQLLTDAMKDELHAWTTADQDGYEYGFHIERVRKLAIGHDGDVPGYQSCMYYLPEHDTSVVVLTNVYGWSIRDMPANRLLLETLRQRFDVTFQAGDD